MLDLEISSAAVVNFKEELIKCKCKQFANCVSARFVRFFCKNKKSPEKTDT